MKRAALACLFLTPLLAQPTGAIEGRITNSVTGEGVPAVVIRFMDTHSLVFKTTTDASGQYRLTGLADGRYGGEFTKDGFADNNGNPLVPVSAGIAGHQDIQLQPWSSLRGRVLDEDGNPAAKVQVELRGSTAPNSTTLTDDAGAFLFEYLPPGSYPLLAKPPSKIRTVDGVRLGAVPIYYPSSTDLSQAVPIVVGKGADLAGLDIRLKSVPVHRVAGRVLDPSGKPAAHSTIRLMGKASTTRQLLGLTMTLAGEVPTNLVHITGPGPEPELARVDSGEDGTFEFPAVEPGDWRLSASLGEDLGEIETPFATVASAQVSVRDVEGMELRLSRPFDVEVLSKWPDPKAPAEIANNARFALTLNPVESQPRLFPDQSKDVGQISELLPGRYRVMAAGAPFGYFPSAVLWGGRDVNGQVVELDPGSDPFQVIFSPGVGTLRGTVEHGEGATVILTPRDSAETTTFREEPCGANGIFEFTGVPPGDYYAVAFNRSNARTLPPNELPNAILPIATNVRIESGATASVELRLNRWLW